MVDYEELKKRILIHRANISSGQLKFDNDSTAYGYLLALDAVIEAMNELNIEECEQETVSGAFYK